MHIPPVQATETDRQEPIYKHVYNPVQVFRFNSQTTLEHFCDFNAVNRNEPSQWLKLRSHIESLCLKLFFFFNFTSSEEHKQIANAATCEFTFQFLAARLGRSVSLPPPPDQREQ